MTQPETATSNLVVTISPETVFISTGNGQTSFADLTITVTNNGDAAKLADIDILLPPSLYTSGSLNSIVPVADDVWSFVNTTTLGVFAAVPKSGASNPLAPKAVFNFTLKKITIAQQTVPAQATLQVKVKLADGTIIPQQLTVAIQQATASIDFFTSQPANINSGQSSNLSWGFTGIDNCTLTPPVLNPPIILTPPYTLPVQVSPLVNTEYTLDAFAAGVHLQKQVNVQVYSPQVISFTSVDGNFTPLNGNVSLEWVTNMAPDATLGNYVTLSTFPQLPNIPTNLPLNTNGTPVVIGPITEAITITLTPGNNIGTGTNSSPLIIDILSVAYTASPNPVLPVSNANATTLSWTVQADIVAIDQGIGNVDPTGTLAITSPINGLYTLSAGTFVKQAMQTVPINLINAYGPYQFNQFGPFMMSGQPMPNMFSIPILNTDVMGHLNSQTPFFYVFEIAGAQLVGTSPGSTLLGFINPQAPSTFVISSTSEDGNPDNTQLEWIDPTNPQGSLTIIKINNP